MFFATRAIISPIKSRIHANLSQSSLSSVELIDLQNELPPPTEDVTSIDRGL